MMAVKGATQRRADVLPPVVTINQRSGKEPEMIATTITVAATFATMLAMFAAAFIDH